MRTFNDICRMTQPKLKEYLHGYLDSLQYNVINEGGFLYAKGTVPVMLVAHMDTVHKSICCEITEANNRISSPQGIGGDDRCGVFMIMNIVKELHCSVLLCEDEEKGGIGARKFTNATYAVPSKDGKETKEKYIDHLNVNYIIEFDRRGHKNVVFYGCDNKEFTKFITETTGYKEEGGSFSDISIIAPAAKIAAVNMSCGYYQAHTPGEYVMRNEMMDTIEVAKKLINTKSNAFKYVAKVYPKFTKSSSFEDDWYSTLCKGKTPTKSKYQQQTLFGNSRQNTFDLELGLEMEIVWEDIDEEERVSIVSGNTKAECWARFFMNNPDVSFSMVVDWTVC